LLGRVAEEGPLMPRLSSTERDAVLIGAAHDHHGYWVCWACGLPTKDPYVKRRVDTGPPRPAATHGVYHRLCKPRRDDKTEAPFDMPQAR
jgi:hypothetical protein